jgi:hypothetical protein
MITAGENRQLRATTRKAVITGELEIEKRSKPSFS